MLRLWLRNEELAWELPEELKPLWRKTFSVRPEDRTFALEPVVREAVRGKQRYTRCPGKQGLRRVVHLAARLLTPLSYRSIDDVYSVTATLLMPTTGVRAASDASVKFRSILGAMSLRKAC